MIQLAEFLGKDPARPGVQTMLFFDRQLTTLHDDGQLIVKDRAPRKRMGLENVPVNSPLRRVNLAHLDDGEVYEFWKAVDGLNNEVNPLPIYGSRWPKSQSGSSGSRLLVEEALAKIYDRTYFKSGSRALEEELVLQEALENYFYDRGAVALKDGDKHADWLLASGLLRECASWIVIEDPRTR